MSEPLPKPTRRILDTTLEELKLILSGGNQVGPDWIDISRRLLTDVLHLRSLIRWHRDQYISGDDKCWKDNERLYAEGLPEGYTPPKRDTLVELKNCERYIASCHDPRVEYVSPQRRIEELEAENAKLKGRVQELETIVKHAETILTSLTFG